MRRVWPRKSRTSTARPRWKACKKSVSSSKMNRQFRDLRPIDGNVEDASATGSKRRDWPGTVALECSSPDKSPKPLSRNVPQVLVRFAQRARSSRHLSSASHQFRNRRRRRINDHFELAIGPPPLARTYLPALDRHSVG